MYVSFRIFINTNYTTDNSKNNETLIKYPYMLKEIKELKIFH